MTGDWKWQFWEQGLTLNESWLEAHTAGLGEGGGIGTDGKVVVLGVEEGNGKYHARGR